MNKFWSLFLIMLSLPLEGHEIQTIENFYISLSDDTKLAARIWLPKDSSDKPVPAILEYIPYRKRDGTRSRDEPIGSWYASHGYAFIRADMRGSGESDGFLADEYLEIEQIDGLELIDWISKQPWCSGNIGMIGKSWGGFNSLQIAAKRPPALKAIITVCSTDDRYADDIHYMGGCLLNDNLWWGAIMVAYQSRPADPQLRSDWKEEWMNRIQNMPFWPAIWMKHPKRDDYWKQGSICEDWQAIQCPVLAVGGWMDAYTNSIPRMLQNLTVPRLGIIGPWAHFYPQDGLPGPAIGFMQESLRWWDHWLKGKESGIMQEPMLRAYIEEWSPPSGWRNPAPGRWVAENSWPSETIFLDKWKFGNHILSKTEHKNYCLSILSPQWTGFCAGEWMGCGVPGEMPIDQRFDDSCSLVFDTAPLTTSLTLLGAPELSLNIASDKPLAFVCARLCDIAPDGSSRRISYQILNLTHRNSHEHPEHLNPGQFYDIYLKLNDCGYEVPAGHCLRVALSTSYWPLIWPTPSPATLTVQTKKSFLLLPIRKARLEDTFVSFELAERGRSTPITLLTKGSFERFTHFDLLTGVATYVTDGQGGLYGEGIYRYDEIGTSISHNLKRQLSIQKDDPLSANYKLIQSLILEKDDWKISIKTNFEMTSDEKQLYLQGELQVFENDTPFANQSFNECINRDHL